MPPTPWKTGPMSTWFTVEKGEKLFKISHNAELPSLFRLYPHMVHIGT